MLHWSSPSMLTAPVFLRAQAAAQSNHPSMVALLLDAGADDCLASTKGETAYYLTAKTGAAEALKVLLKQGRNATACMDKHVRGKTPLMAAAARGHGAVIRALLYAKASLSPPSFNKALLENEVDTVLKANGNLDGSSDGISFDIAVNGWRAQEWD